VTSTSTPVISAQILSLISKQQQQFQQQLHNSLSRVQVSNAVAAAAAIAAQKCSTSSNASLLTTLSVAKTPTVTSSTLAAAIRTAPGGLVGVGGAGITPNINQLLPSKLIYMFYFGCYYYYYHYYFLYPRVYSSQGLKAIKTVLVWLSVRIVLQHEGIVQKNYIESLKCHRQMLEQE